MTRLVSVLVLIAFAPAALAQERVTTRSLTCAALQARVAQARNLVLATSETAYETVHLDSGSCRIDETAAPAFEPTADVPSCMAGWRCRQRNSDSGPR
ncbi:hypothetical protein MMSR116_26375 [Methylobacterium mesophilicum SR1.6/6]|uniref:Uncharacterized protein n=1 Tax=Methylobacterium mesophilicum SR1.6/6 TaxID=908290 RepID=A0A6B9FQZ0_9HYPH|nr:hypothetical protein [Methylobacterium mesophilicum]QGY05031.1 hypothetical protein MMSR116_26375 [Methylobacterium mesophilicum SR1.6/6]